MNKVINVKFKEWNCEVIKQKYSNGRVALQLIEVGTGDPIAMATVNVPDIKIPEGEVFIKDYSENEGMLACLIKAKIVKPTGGFVRNGYVEIPACKLLI